MIKLKIDSGLRRLATDMGKLNRRNFNRARTEIGAQLAEKALAAAKDRMTTDLPRLSRRGRRLLKLRKLRFGAVAIVLDEKPNPPISTRIRLAITGGRVKIPSRELRHFLIIEDQRYSPAGVYRLLQLAYSGRVESRGQYRTYVTDPPVNGVEFALSVGPRGIHLYRRVRRYRKQGKRSVKVSQKIAFLPYEVNFTRRYKFFEAVDRSIDRNRGPVTNKVLQTFFNPLVNS